MLHLQDIQSARSLLPSLHRPSCVSPGTDEPGCLLCCAAVPPLVSPRSCGSSCLSTAVTSPACVLHALTSTILNVLDQSHIDSQCARPLQTDRRRPRLRWAICSFLTLSHTFSLPSFFHRHVYPALCRTCPSSLDTYVGPMSHIHLDGSVGAARARAWERVVKADGCLLMQASGSWSEPNHQLHLAFQE